jgi:hypothetical protein
MNRNKSILIHGLKEEPLPLPELRLPMGANRNPGGEVVVEGGE